MLRRLAFRFRLYPTAAQAEKAWRTIGICRAVRNAALEQRRVWGRQHRITALDQCNELRVLKAELPWVADAPHHCLQQAIRDVDAAFNAFFAGRAGYPKFQKRGQRDSFRYPDPKQFRWTDAAIFLPKLGWVKWRQHREIVGKAKTVTVSRDGDWWFASVQVEDEAAEPAKRHGPTVGIDMGIAVPIALSDGTTFELAKLQTRHRKRLRALKQALARKRRSSRNREKARRKLASYEAHLARRRLDLAHRTAVAIARDYAHVAMEDLRIKSMTASARGTADGPGTNVKAKAGLNRALLDVAPGQFRLVLQDKLERSGGTLTLVEPKNSSRTCAECGHIAAESRKSQAAFCCISCGHTAHADVNAARNIAYRASHAQTGGRPGMACGSNHAGGRKQEGSAISVAA